MLDGNGAVVLCTCGCGGTESPTLSFVTSVHDGGFQLKTRTFSDFCSRFCDGQCLVLVGRRFTKFGRPYRRAVCFRFKIACIPAIGLSGS